MRNEWVSALSVTSDLRRPIPVPGVNSGGMDQSASILSVSNSALYITFFPHLDAELVTLPTTIPGTQEEEAVFVVANSLVVSDKVVGKLVCPISGCEPHVFHRYRCKNAVQFTRC